MGAAPSHVQVQCTVSSLGYACSKELNSGGATLHWTAGTAAPPDNACTRGSAAYPPSAPSAPPPTGSASSNASTLLHLAVWSPRGGYASLAFTAKAGRMSPSDAVIGRVGLGGAIGGVVETFTTSGYNLNGAVSPSWAQDSSVVALGAAAGGGTLLCFSVATAGGSGAVGRRRGRALAEAAGNGSPTLDLTALLINFADSNSNSITGHDSTATVRLNTVTGAAEIVNDKTAAVVVHGMLMLAAWVLLLPFGVLSARHRWVLGGARFPCAPKAKEAWFYVHVTCQLTGLVCFIAGFVLAVIQLEIQDTSGPAAAHKVAGYVLVGVAGAQLVVGFVRPAPDAPRRPLWNGLHHNLGRVAMLLAWAVSSLGMFLASSRHTQPLVAWVAPAAAVLGVLAVADLVLSVARSRRAGAGGSGGGGEPRFTTRMGTWAAG
ncbi:hypothetical protein TSOC_011066 [Tetrabaena socialis]|uniref:Cytochrome b561 domain-containing protein n=1 Tax=Tetrabaena socialis TaxID=47790 RepID=A0A2J7ZRL9_9CHLO|nr:hypothetical protein TSOC_011066 [Tetrabaena socialis]|eukprot:PNH02921.1 hypothetical protein TSOC_011066 [Tetrabaena socialis]